MVQFLLIIVFTTLYQYLSFPIAPLTTNAAKYSVQ